jgi:hypothetical protein
MRKSRASQFKEAVITSLDLRSPEAGKHICDLIDATGNFKKKVFVQFGMAAVGSFGQQAVESLSSMYSVNGKSHLDKLQKKLNIPGFFYAGCSDHYHPSQGKPTHYLYYNPKGMWAFNENDNVVHLNVETP